MTVIFYPDLSSYNAGIRIQPATVAVCARASLSDQVADGSYADFRGQAANVGALFFAYHWLNHGNAEAQAEWCHRIVGGTPLMIDAEDVPGNTGYAGPLTVQDILGFTAAYRALGGIVHLVYLPRWYWSGHMGSPNLTSLAATGLSLVSSDYGPYSDTGPGWAPYGGLAPAVWQYTDALTYGGRSVDFNAFRGTVAEFATLIGGTMTQPQDFLADTNAAILAYRMDAIAAGADTVRGGPAQGESLWLVTAVKDIQAKVSALTSPPAVDPHELASEIVTELEAAGVLTGDGAHAIIKNVLTAAAQAA